METTDGSADASQRADDARDASSRAAERTEAAARKMRESRQTMKRLAGEVADTETHLASTLRRAAGIAERHGRQEDADRLTEEATRAERYAEVERKRADADD